MPFPNIDELGKQNMAMMERAMSLLSPLGRREETPAEVDTLKAEVEHFRRELAALKAPGQAPHVRSHDHAMRPRVDKLPCCHACFALLPARGQDDEPFPLSRNRIGIDDASTQRAGIVDHHVGARIRERRTMLGVVSAAAREDDRGDVPAGAHKYERGLNRISAGRLFEIAQVLNVPVSCFFEGLQPGTEASPSRPASACSSNWPAISP